ncbi:MAG: hypothetical protein KC656_38020 [Myxococcales bacterium]|nr:hypothetical protein [Myxococcales bacterium]
MKASVIRKLAKEHTLEELEAGAESIAENETDTLGVEGDDLGEKLTHVMLAIRIVSRMNAGEDLKDAFRAEMSAVREILENE